MYARMLDMLINNFQVMSNWTEIQSFQWSCVAYSGQDFKLLSFLFSVFLLVHLVHAAEVSH